MVPAVQVCTTRNKPDSFQHHQTSKIQDIGKSAYLIETNRCVTSCHKLKGCMATKKYIIYVLVLLDLAFGKWQIYLSCENYDGKDFPS